MLEKELRNRAGFADFYHPAKTLRNFLSLLPAAEYGNLTAGGHFCNCSGAGEQGGRGGLFVLLLASALTSKEENKMRLKMSLQLFLALMDFLLFPLSAVVQCCS